MPLKFEYVYQSHGNLVKMLILGRSKILFFLTSSLTILLCWSVDHSSISEVLGYELISKILTTRANFKN